MHFWLFRRCVDVVRFGNRETTNIGEMTSLYGYTVRSVMISYVSRMNSDTATLQCCKYLQCYKY